MLISHLASSSSFSPFGPHHPHPPLPHSPLLHCLLTHNQTLEKPESLVNMSFEQFSKENYETAKLLNNFSLACDIMKLLHCYHFSMQNAVSCL